jgi:hypothetical protein
VRFPLPPAEPSSSERWSTPGFASELRGFVEGILGPVRLEQHKLRPWSTVWRAYAGEGLFWAKQNCPGSRFEAALLELLGEVVPDRVVPLAGLDRGRGLLLTPDVGDVLGFDDADLDTWSTIVRQWALLQRALLPHTARIAAAGVPDLWVRDSELLVRERAEALHALPVDDPRRLSDREHDRLVEALPVVREAVEVVGALGLPLALNHNDLHGNNVFAPVAGDDPLRFFDLGDAMLTDPSGVLMVPLRCLRAVLGCAPDDPRLWRVADAWVEVWSDLAPAPAIRAALPSAMRLARLARHDSWLRVTPGMRGEEADHWVREGGTYLVDVPDAPLLGAAD